MPDGRLGLLGVLLYSRVEWSYSTADIALATFHAAHLVNDHLLVTEPSVIERGQFAIEHAGLSAGRRAKACRSVRER